MVFLFRLLLLLCLWSVLSLESSFLLLLCWCSVNAVTVGAIGADNQAVAGVVVSAVPVSFGLQYCSQSSEEDDNSPKPPPNVFKPPSDRRGKYSRAGGKGKRLSWLEHVQRHVRAIFDPQHATPVLIPVGQEHDFLSTTKPCVRSARRVRSLERQARTQKRVGRRILATFRTC